ncbi:extracellular solute-binding protein [Paraburkholderia sp. DHOC27]|uniref:extracellular solute-binding protein n=1 Tax=Paraburkholderia sp. DHOC27 TaxID=2303330 RepID=UPI000E3DDF56|nr:extracellular solute-binding protein [Paraburkholderia sp. DHOC27]RFU48432.1 extracellular solute-binding protein [Paraburkholderia sp. DHOC27]
MTITLRGMTWDHPRGYAPLAACAALWREREGVEITWDRRSLQDFESFPVDELARRYDLIVIDHPHVGQITREACLRPFDLNGVRDIAEGSIGESFASYHWQGQQWALPIDAAAQVMAWRPDRLPDAPRNWEQVFELARAGRVALPMRAPHSLMCLYTLCAQLGAPGNVTGPDLFEPEIATQVCDYLRTLMQWIDPACYEMDPIAVYEAMAQPDARIDCVPLIYGYVNYAYEGFRPVQLAFADIPHWQGNGPRGSALGGTGIAVSARSEHPDEAFAFARWVAGAAAQSGPFAAAGGQPGHATAWDDATVNAASNNFYRATRETLDRAWVRPRHDGYMPFQHAASERFVQGLRTDEAPAALIAELNRMFRQSLPA